MKCSTHRIVKVQPLASKTKHITVHLTYMCPVKGKFHRGSDFSIRQDIMCDNIQASRSPFQCKRSSKSSPHNLHVDKNLFKRSALQL